MADPSEPSLRSPAKINWRERRSSVRHPCLETSRRLVAAIGDDFCLAKVRNISAGGVSLVLGRPLEAGTVLAVDLIDTQTNQFSRTLDVRVCYCVEHPSGDWILGGSFAELLSADEMRYFTTAKAPT
ncbi:MAG: PilZ domain-containing protein [Planctomycetia bacterium]|nr:PilZ domain-containing protein [Planctomycetia bacterium]